ncbi:MAG: sigma-70 family RNA polymerase sigma factor [Tissierellia bacterium]|nr:sigma-70 family RNA polymerase sigma factor [Tissierellia bacterium]
MKKNKAIPSQFCKDVPYDGDEDLLAFMYKTYAGNLYAYGLSFHSGIGIIEDAIHDVFIDIYTNKKRFSGIFNLQQYLRTAFRHRLLFLLQRSRRYVDNLNDISDLFAEENSQEVWIETEEEDDKKKLVHNLLSGLTQHQREAIHLRFIEGLSYEEISEIMQIKFNSVKTLIQRSMYRIRNKNIPSSPNTD